MRNLLLQKQNCNFLFIVRRLLRNYTPIEFTKNKRENGAGLGTPRAPSSTDVRKDPNVIHLPCSTAKHMHKKKGCFLFSFLFLTIYVRKEFPAPALSASEVCLTALIWNCLRVPTMYREAAQLTESIRKYRWPSRGAGLQTLHSCSIGHLTFLLSRAPPRRPKPISIDMSFPRARNYK